MTRMRVLAVFLLSAAVVVTLSCQSGREKPELTFAVGGAPNEIAFWTEIIGDFEKQFGENVHLLRQPTDTDQRRHGLLVPLSAKKADPDVFLMDVAWVSHFAASGWLESLDDLFREIGAGSFFDWVLTLSDSYGGRLLALPVYVDGGLLYFRKDLLAKHGYREPPRTWEELVEISRKIQSEERKKNPDFYAFVWQGAQYEGLMCNFLEFAASGGGGIVLGGGGISLNNEENVEALKLMRDLIHAEGLSPPNTYTEMREEEVRTYFQLGNAAFQRNWPYAFAIHQQEGSPVKGRVGIAPLPHFPSGRSVSTLGGWHIGISRHSDVPGRARKLVQYILSYETQKKLVMELGWNSGRKDIYGDGEILKKYPHLRELSGALEHALLRPAVPYYTQLSAVIQRYLNAAIAGKMDPEEALREAERESRKVIERYAGQ